MLALKYISRKATAINQVLLQQVKNDSFLFLRMFSCYYSIVLVIKAPTGRYWSYKVYRLAARSLFQNRGHFTVQ